MHCGVGFTFMGGFNLSALCFQVVFNDWSGDGSEMNGVRGDAVDGLGGSNSLPLSLSVPVCYMRNPNPRSPTRPFRTAHLRYVLLEAIFLLIIF